LLRPGSFPHHSFEKTLVCGAWAWPPGFGFVVVFSFLFFFFCKQRRHKHGQKIKDLFSHLAHAHRSGINRKSAGDGGCPQLSVFVVRHFARQTIAKPERSERHGLTHPNPDAIGRTICNPFASPKPWRTVYASVPRAMRPFEFLPPPLRRRGAIPTCAMSRRRSQQRGPMHGLHVCVASRFHAEESSRKLKPGTAERDSKGKRVESWHYARSGVFGLSRGPTNPRPICGGDAASTQRHRDFMFAIAGKKAQREADALGVVDPFERSTSTAAAPRRNEASSCGNLRLRHLKR
jgi:hypothetical protein